MFSMRIRAGNPAGRCTRAGFSLVSLCLAATLGCSDSDNVLNPPAEIVRGSGVAATEDRVIAGVSTVAMSAFGDLYVESGAQESLRLEAEDNLLGYLQTYLDNGTLRIRKIGSVDLRPTLPIEFHLTVPALDGIVHTGVGSVEAVGLTGAALVVVHSGVSTMNFDDLDLGVLEVTMSGVGEIEASGTVNRQQVVLTGVGTYEAEGLDCVDAEMTLSGLGSATLRASGTLDVTISGSGSLGYYGDPVLTVNGTGSGQVTRLGD